MGIDCNIRKTRRQVDLEYLLLCFGQSSYAINYRKYYVTQPVRRCHKRKSAALDSGKIEKIRDQELHFIGRTLNLINEGSHLVRINIGASKQMDRKFDVCQRI